MKTKIWSLILGLTLSTLGSNSFADRASGGGNGPQSTVAEAENAIKGVEYGAHAVIMYTGLNKPEVLKKIENNEVREALTKIINEPLWDFSSNVILGQAQEPRIIEFNILKTQKCSGENNKEADASTSFKPGAKICISALGLSRYPGNELTTETTALLFHELTHQVGYKDDNVPNKVQNYIRAKVRSFLTIYTTRRALNDLKNAAQNQDGLAFTCSQMGVVTGLLTPRIERQSRGPLVHSMDLSTEESQILSRISERFNGNSEKIEWTSIRGLLPNLMKYACAPRQSTTEANNTIQLFIKLVDLFVESF